MPRTIKVLADGEEASITFHNDLKVIAEGLGDEKRLALHHTFTHEGVIRDVVDANGDNIGTDQCLYDDAVEDLTEE